MAERQREDANLAIADAVDALVRPIAGAEGVELIEVAVKGEASMRRVKVIVDAKGGVTLDTCQVISRQLGTRLDELADTDDDPLPGRYTLEVTSPGTDRPLTDRAAFDRVEGRLVKVVLEVGEDSTRELVGTVGEAGAEGVVVAPAEGEAETVPYADIVVAKQELPW